MRKVTIAVVSAFIAGNPLCMGNTSTDGTNLFLFGNRIAYKNDGSLFIDSCGWKTITTKERLNGLPNVSICQSKGIWYLNGKEWQGSLMCVGELS